MSNWLIIFFRTLEILVQIIQIIYHLSQQIFVETSLFKNKRVSFLLLFELIFYLLGKEARFREKSFIKQKARLSRIRLRGGSGGVVLRMNAVWSAREKGFRRWLTMSDWHLWRWMNRCENENEWQDALGQYYKREDVRKGFCEFSCDSSSLCIFFLFFFFEIECIVYASWKFIIDINWEIMLL